MLSISPVAIGRVVDQPLDGTPDFTDAGNSALEESWRELRAVAEFPLSSLSAAPSLASLSFVLNVPAGGDDVRQLQLAIYAGDGAVGLNDFDSTPIEVRTIYYWSSQTSRDYRFDVTDSIAQLMASGATHLGIRLDSVGELSETRLFSPVLNIDALPAAAGFRGIASVPNAILANDTDSFRVEVDTHGDVAGVTMSLFGQWNTDHVNGVVTLRDDGLSGDTRAGDFVFTSPPIRYHANPDLPIGFYQGQVDSPPAISIQDVGDVFVTELDGTQNQFFRRAEIGLLRSDHPLVEVQMLDADVQVSDHFINIRTAASATQRTMRGSQIVTHPLFQKLYETLPDAFDIVNLVSTNRVEQLPRLSGSNFRAGVHAIVQTDFTGTNRPLSDNSASYYSEGRLKGYSMLDDFRRGLAGSTVTHELVHQWSAWLHSSLGISDGGGHYLNNTSVGSLVGGYEWIDNGDGSYTMNGDEGRSGATHASPLDLYFMGLIEADDVPPIKVFNPAADPPIHLLNPHIPADQIIDEVTIDEIIAAHGARTPSVADSQKAFNIGFVGESNERFLTPVEMTFYEILAAHYTKQLPEDQPAPSSANGWSSIAKFFGHGSTWSTLVPGRTEDANQAPATSAATFVVSETVPPYYLNGGGSIVGRVPATDPDSQPLTFAIRSGNETNDFKIDPVTGDIRVSRPLSRDRQEIYQMEVVIADSGTPSQSVVTQITIQVTGQNRAPQIADQSFAINENSPAGTSVGAVVASDPDSGQSLQYAITAGADGAFVIDAVSGAIRVAPGALLNFETKSAYQLTVVVSDSGVPSLQSQAIVTINIGDVGELPQIADQSFSVNENSPTGTGVGTVVASDPDSGQSLQYAITAGADGAFVIDAVSGTISVAPGALLDFETKSVYQLTVVVSDSGVPSLQAQATVQINIGDVQELPVFFIDIDPGDATNTFLLTDSTVRVAILSSATFNANQRINVSSLRFGKTGTETGVVTNRKGVPQVQATDVNADGFVDLVVSFTTQATGLTVNDTSAVLTGTLTNGMAFSKSQVVKITSGKGGGKGGGGKP